MKTPTRLVHEQVDDVPLLIGMAQKFASLHCLTATLAVTATIRGCRTAP